jgi:hypothetical protein
MNHRFFFLVRLMLVGTQHVAAWIILVSSGFFLTLSVLLSPFVCSRLVCLFDLLLNQLFVVINVHTILFAIILSGEQRNWS